MLINKLKWLLLKKLIRWAVRSYKFDVLLTIFWAEFRSWYPEDNTPSAIATVIEVLEDEDKK